MNFPPHSNRLPPPGLRTQALGHAQHELEDRHLSARVGHPDRSPRTRPGLPVDDSLWVRTTDELFSTLEVKYWDAHLLGLGGRPLLVLPEDVREDYQPLGPELSEDPLGVSRERSQFVGTGRVLRLFFAVYLSKEKDTLRICSGERLRREEHPCHTGVGKRPRRRDLRCLGWRQAQAHP